MFLNETDTVDLFTNVIQLRAGGRAEPATRASLAGSGDAWTLAAFHFDSDESVHAHAWERHPAGQEVLCVHAGAIAVYLRDHGDSAEPVATMTAGDSFILPAGRWHRLGSLPGRRAPPP